MQLANVLASGTAILVALAPLAGVAQTLPWMETSLPPEQRTALLVPAMTLDEKVRADCSARQESSRNCRNATGHDTSTA